MSDYILIVDDDASIRKLLTKVVTYNGFNCLAASNGDEALTLINQYNFQLILLDIMMDHMDGFQVLQKIREQGIDTPIIIISGRIEDYDALYGLDLGADDYITKPFNPVVLGAKIKALIRRSNYTQSEQTTTIQLGPFKLKTKNMKFYKDSKEIPLSSKEMLMMRLFLEHPGQVFSKSMLYEHIWGDLAVDDNSIMVYISHLRNKIEDDPKKPTYIKTVWGMGYQFSVSS